MKNTSNLSSNKTKFNTKSATLSVLALSLLTILLPQNAVLASKNPFIPHNTRNISIQKFTIPNKITPFLNPWNTVYTGYGTVEWDANA